MARNNAQSSIAYAAPDLSEAQRAHLGDLEAKRRRMVDIRRGRAAAPGLFDADRERKLGELRAAGRLHADQELFLRLCGPEEVDRQYALHRFFGARYEGVIAPSIRNRRDERRTQKHARAILRAYERGRVSSHGVDVARSERVAQTLGRVRRFMRHLKRHRGRRVVRRAARVTADSGSDGSSDPPPGRAHSLSAFGGAS